MSSGEPSLLELARELVQQLADARPPEVRVADIGVRQKAPYKAQVVRGALLWRTEEIARAACDLLERNDVVAGILLTRATLESAALIWRLRDLIENRSSMCIEEIDATLMKMLMGSKTDISIPAINILTLIDRIDKVFVGIRGCYDTLSEFAHPNFSGVARSYSRIIASEYRTVFAKQISDRQEKEVLAEGLLCTALEIFIKGYNDVSDLFDQWVKELEPLGASS